MHITVSLLLSLLVLLVCRRFHRLCRWRLRQKALQDYEKEAKKFLDKPTYLEHLLAVAEIATNERQEEALESVTRWGFVRAGLGRQDLHGIGTYEARVLDFLEHAAGSSLLGIWGKHGMGKSTLLRIIQANYPSYWSYRPFEYIIYLELDYGGCSSVAMFHQVLATTVGVGRRRRTRMSSALLAATISRLLEDTTFLLMLDDVPDDGIDLAAIGLPMPLGHRQKVVFTARDQAVCVRMGCAAGDAIQMERLGEDDAWNLFRYHVGEETLDSDPEIEHIAKEMVAECRGFPKALCTVGRSMTDETDCSRWRVAYNLLTIKSRVPNEIQDMSDEGYPCLKYFEGPYM